jgi:hypothetical protein
VQFSEPRPLAVYYEGGTRDRYFLAPEGLGLGEALRQRASRWYKTPDGARKAMLRSREVEA